ncbi:hypothetical protein KQR54_18220 [Mycobacterium gordonae]|nr:hypothetical protein [Mycobacterium gordonae]
MQIRYVLDPRSRNFIVTLPELAQKISVLPGIMSRIVGTHPRTVLASTSINALQAARLGFLLADQRPLPEVIANVG